MTKTPNIALNVIPFDQNPWDVETNENVVIMDGLFGQYFAIANFKGTWKNATTYAAGDNVVEVATGALYICNVGNTSATAPTTFAADRTARPTLWTLTGAGAASYASAAAASAATAAAVATSNVGRNLLHNSRFGIQQRGTGPWAVDNLNTADRWKMNFSGGTMSCSIGTYSDANRVTIGDESAVSYLLSTVVGGAAAGNFSILSQYIDGLSRLAGKTVTLSFWANATAGTPKLGIGFRQSFGTGGAPSANVDIAGQSVTLTTVPARYTVTFVVPSIAGKTFGTTVGSAFMRLSFAFSSGATSAAIFGTPGVQSNTFVLWGMQLEFGGSATALEVPSLQQQIAECQRFYQTGAVQHYGYSLIGATVSMSQVLAGSMRIIPTVTFASVLATNMATQTMNSVDVGSVNLNGTLTATGVFASAVTFTASADF